MYWYELFESDPGFAVIYIIFSFALTLAAYSAFPLLFAKKRQAPISGRKYKTICFCVNFVVWILFAIINGEASSGAAFLLWTTVFSRKGIRHLEEVGVLDGFQPVSKTTKHQPRMTSSEKDAAVRANGPYIDSANENPSLGHSAQTPFFFSSTVPTLTARSLGELFTTADGQHLSFSKKATSYVGPAGASGGLCEIYEARKANNELYGELVVNVMCNQTTRRPPVGYAFIPTSPHLPPHTEQQPLNPKEDHDAVAVTEAPLSVSEQANDIPLETSATAHQDHTSNQGSPVLEKDTAIPESQTKEITTRHSKVTPDGRKFVLISRTSVTFQSPVEDSASEAGTNEIAETPVFASMPPPASFCWKCGTKLLPGGTFCHICGTKTISTIDVEEF